ncbi:hypothetical protein HYN48_13230 [Flavobacterium magnum]|uniref:Uncharacterized protein n=1 Tax=Flavobacterium magnum TaxID=2162713 RepID=A0A2S0RJR7_9FLAO|nr:hypothetical protein [Flavobacterium magnum]AWA30962.1 hypothetical protein HYN48_13230 [Flavobacterium magnum]
MNASTLNKFLKDKSKVSLLKAEIDAEVSEYKKLMEKIGSSISIYFHEDESTFLNTYGLLNLINQTINGYLKDPELNYICDCLTLAENVEFENEKIKEIVFEIADQEIWGNYKSVDELKAITKILQK